MATPENNSIRKIAGACLNQTPLDWENNRRNILEAIQSAQREKVEILCLPELCITGYGCEDTFLSEWLAKEAMLQLLEIVQETKHIAVVIGLPVRFKSKNYNCIAVVENKILKGFYAKHHLANEGVHYEPRWFSSWPIGLVDSIEINNIQVPFGSITSELAGIKCGFEICEDAWHEERPAKYLQKIGVSLILNPSASHFAFGKAAFREKLVCNSSDQFNCAYLYTNLLGNEAGRMVYDGDILVAQQGKLLARNRRLSFKNYNLLSVQVDFEGINSQTQIQLDFKDQLDEFSHAVPLALFDYMRKSRSKGFVLSLSGGADSGSIATLVAHMVRLGVSELGNEDFSQKLNLKTGNEKLFVKNLLFTAYQGTVNSSKETRNSARILAESIGSTHFEWNIDEQVNKNVSTIAVALNRDLTWEEDDIALQNIQARTRSPLIWMLANVKQCLLLTTSNRSEGDVGYATMDGDTSGSISPIAGVSKIFILKWLRYAELQLGYQGLHLINQLTPTAELRPLEQAQSDEKDLMPYAVLAEIEREAIFHRKSPVEVFELMKTKHDPEKLKFWINRFYKLWSMNQWKRERIAPSFHLDDFNVDPRSWCRFPILSGSFEQELKELNTKPL